MIRRAAVWLSTIVVAAIVAFAVPVSQLRTVAIVKSCCCPDPSDCHCPDHATKPPSSPAMRACHNTEQVIVAPQLPAFHAPVMAMAPVSVAVTVAFDQPIPSPHPAPPPARPDAPS
jgi:hypothetical protein